MALEHVLGNVALGTHASTAAEARLRGGHLGCEVRLGLPTRFFRVLH